tara:strand:+ start:1822 stop:4746 length:2925 start_codon:yes stop_codon:yes gene_type:complete
MPKQVYKLDQFHSGINNNSDPRDLSVGELADARDVMLDNIGRIRTGPSIVAHASASPAPPTTDSVDDRSGTSLFAFSHDYKYAGQGGNIIKNGSSNMNSGSIWGGHATSGPQSWVSSSTNFVFTGSVTGDAAITQTAANRLTTGVNGATYKLTYTISNYALTSGSPELKILTGSGQFAADGDDGGEDDTILTYTNGTHERVFVSSPSATSNVFSIHANTGAQWTITLDDIKLELVSVDSSGDDYLAMYLNTSGSNYGFGIYSYSADTWASASDSMRFNAVTTAAEPIFTQVDGVLRVVDKLKGASCYKIWYSYIDRNRWGTSTVYCRKWVNAQSPLIAPTDSDIVLSATGSTYLPDEGKIEISSDYGFSTNVAKSGGWNPNGVTGTATGGSGNDKLVSSGTTFTASMVGMRVRRSNNTTATAIITGFEDSNTVHCSKIISDSSSTTQSGTLTWSSGGTADTFQIYDYYELGFTWVYDGNQESLIHNRTAIYRPSISNFTFYIQDIAAGHGWDTESTARITASNMYYRKESDNTNTWYHLCEIDLNKGLRKSGEEDFNITWTQITSKTEYHLQEIYIDSPLTFETYETKNGFKSDVTEILDLSASSTGYSASVIANRTHYIGNVKYADKDGVVRNHADAMFKSMPNRFDTFPLNRKIEVSVQDGDEITALATYADRILQFKKNKMHLINVSQEIEFLEDTFQFKGVIDSSAICKTDYGIAWVNLDGCYLYNGKEVKNLLEREGVRKIVSNGYNSTTSGWVYNHTFKPSIAYLPKERQLLVAKDHSGQDASAGAQSAWIYNLITQSWVLQDGEFITGDGAEISNLITDHKGDIVYFTGTGSLKTLSTSSSAKTACKVLTPDIDFGNPSTRKKIYRVRISYKGDASSLNIYYGINGDTNSWNNFEGTSSGKPTGSADTTPLEDKSGDTSVWHHAELKPAVSSVTANVYSFQFVIKGTAGASFEINDISIIYREKSVK